MAIGSGELVAMAAGIALSPFGIIPAILLLFTARPKAAAAAFLFGWAGGVALAFFLATLLAGFLQQPEQPPAWIAWARSAFGLLLLLLAGRQWARRHAAAAAPAWMVALSAADPRTALRYGGLLTIANPKVLLLALGAGLSAGPGLTSAQALLAAGAFALAASLSVAAPLVLYALFGERMLRPLGRARAWLESNNAAIMAVVLLAFGILLLRKGLGGI